MRSIPLGDLGPDPAQEAEALSLQDLLSRQTVGSISSLRDSSEAEAASVDAAGSSLGPGRALNSPARCFLEITCGAVAHLTAAVLKSRRAILQPLQMDASTVGQLQARVSQDSLAMLLRLAWSGAVAFVQVSVPFDSWGVGVSVFRGPESALAPPETSGSGPRSATQDPEYLMKLLAAVHAAGGHVGWELSSESTARNAAENQLLLGVNAVCVQVPSALQICAGPWHLTSSFRPLQFLCQATIPAVQQNNGQSLSISGSMLQFSNITADAFARIVAELLDGDADEVTQWMQAGNHLPRFATFRSSSSTVHRVADGGGICSTADWAAPPAGKWDCFKDLRHAWSRIILDSNIHKQVVASFAQGRRESPLTEPQIEQLTNALLEFAAGIHEPVSLEVAEGQPIRLDCMRVMQLIMGDADTALAAVLAPGVSAGVFEPVSASGVWLRRWQPDLQEHLPLLCCSSNWLSAEQAPEVVTTLVQQDLRDQFVKRFDGPLEEARMKWPLGIAVGKLGVTTVEGRDPRLTLGSTEPNVNPNVRINEKTFNPGHRDVSACSPDALSQESFVGFTMDVSKAHKRIKVRHEDQGLLMFRHAGILYYYVVCHFGGSFSAYWWSRVGSALTRISHQLLWVSHAGWLYVDDWLWRLLASVAPLHASLLVALMCVLKVPMSWHKCHLKAQIDWIGL
ncbi:unnamed protein product [Polarella glacialis]|uniref:Uncharacterized protein n=1 Tax=Polarella glacialis TaxID=89957 RepID=A0A813D4K0_POLGL|nr:unnamed protein product [Polarella glacialis]